jgi:hypothetical protein
LKAGGKSDNGVIFTPCRTYQPKLADKMAKYIKVRLRRADPRQEIIESERATAGRRSKLPGRAH